MPAQTNNQSQALPLFHRYITQHCATTLLLKKYVIFYHSNFGLF